MVVLYITGGVNYVNSSVEILLEFLEECSADGFCLVDNCRYFEVLPRGLGEVNPTSSSAAIMAWIQFVGLI